MIELAFVGIFKEKNKKRSIWMQTSLNFWVLEDREEKGLNGHARVLEGLADQGTGHKGLEMLEWERDCEVNCASKTLSIS